MSNIEYLLTVPDQKQEFIQELLQAFSCVKLTPNLKKTNQKLDATDYLLSTAANTKALDESIAQIERGEVVMHELRQG